MIELATAFIVGVVVGYACRTWIGRKIPKIKDRL